MPAFYPLGYPSPDQDVLWRVEAKAENDIFTGRRLVYLWYAVAKRTRCGARLTNGKFILLTAYKRWAHETQQQALGSFVLRRRRQVAILRNQLERAQQELQLGREEGEQNVRLQQPTPQ